MQKTRSVATGTLKPYLRSIAQKTVTDIFEFNGHISTDIYKCPRGAIDRELIDDRSQMTQTAYNEKFANQNKTNSSSSKLKVFVQLPK